MNFLIAESFTASLARLNGQEQKAAKTTAFDLQLDPANPGFKFHKLDRARDSNFWSVRVNRNLRLIVHRTSGSLLLCYIGHHDDAYRWAERRKLERHPKTGAAQFVEVREVVEEMASMAPPPAAAYAARATLFDGIGDDDLLGYGVPPEWLDEVRGATEDTLLDLAGYLPAEAAEALLALAAGDTPEMAARTAPEADPFAHPDARRRFRVLANVEELEQALAAPWERWTVFLHPAQREVAERDYGGPVRVSGSAGTGKTVVALHRAVQLARRHPERRALLTTFSRPLANALARKVALLTAEEESLRGRIAVHTVRGIAYELVERADGTPTLASTAQLRNLIEKAAAKSEESRFSLRFLLSEWTDVVDAWQLGDREAYRDVRRHGRKTRIGGKQREALWSIFAEVREGLERRKLLTWPMLFARAAALVQAMPKPAFDHVVVDEAQDMGIPELRFLAALGAGQPDGLFFTGDLGQRIFQQPFSWKALGIDIRGRSHVNAGGKTSHAAAQWRASLSYSRRKVGSFSVVR
ncbi:MAG: UvrD-helicase domain-containing protein [Rhodospirillaceae bacterium]